MAVILQIDLNLCYVFVKHSLDPTKIQTPNYAANGWKNWIWLRNMKVPEWNALRNVHIINPYLDNPSRPKIEIPLDDVAELRRSVGSTVVKDGHGERFRDSDGIRDLCRKSQWLSQKLVPFWHLPEPDISCRAPLWRATWRPIWRRTRPICPLWCSLSRKRPLRHGRPNRRMCRRWSCDPSDRHRS